MGSQPEEAGRYARHQRQSAGSTARLPSPAEIPPLMGDFGQWLARAGPTPATAFEAHWRLVAIHPFADGNGRTARLLMNLILLRAGYPPVVIDPEQRPDYVDALETRRMSGDAEAYRRFMAVRLSASLDHHLEIAATEFKFSSPGA